MMTTSEPGRWRRVWLRVGRLVPRRGGAATISALAVIVLVGTYAISGGEHVSRGVAASVTVVPPRSPLFVFSKGAVWQSDAITRTNGFDTRSSRVVAAISRDAIDMQGAGIRWVRWWVGPDYSVDQVSTVARIFGKYGIKLVLDVNSSTDSALPTEIVLKDWLSRLVPSMASLGDHYWEIGNEPNIDYRAGGYWNDCAAGVTPSAAANQADVARAVASYVVRLRDAYTTIHTADGSALVSSAGLSYDDYYSQFCEITSDQWIAQFIHTDAWQYMDCFGIHPYADTSADVVAALAETRGDLGANPLYATVPFCITELGFQSSQGMPEAERAAEYVTLMNRLRSYGIDTPVFWYTWYDYNAPIGYGVVGYRGLTVRSYLPLYFAVRAYRP